MVISNNFNEFILAIEQAFSNVNSRAQEEQIKQLNNYFNDKKEPICSRVKIPNISENGDVVYSEVDIPLISLVPISTLKLNEANIDFKIIIKGEVSIDSDDGEKSYISYSPESTVNSSSESYANVSLKFQADTPPDGVLKLRDSFIRVIP